MNTDVERYVKEAKKIKSQRVLEDYIEQGDIVLIAGVRTVLADEDNGAYTANELKVIAETDNALKKLFTPDLLDALYWNYWGDKRIHNWWGN